MGQKFIDAYSLLHFAAGIVAYFWNIPLVAWIILHSVFEWYENTVGLQTIGGIKMWPGGKSSPDSLTNIFGDTAFAILGWLVAYWVKEKSSL